MITPEQMRMARAALNMTTREFGKELDLSAMAISRFERGDDNVISIATARRITEWLEKKRIYLGPKDAVCINQNVFEQDRWHITALFQLLKDNGIKPNSSDLIDAHRRATE